MTDSEFAGTRPISVAELLAKNGTIGAPPVGGRRRRRRGNSDSVSVAELTGEIPVVNSLSLGAPTELEQAERSEVDDSTESQAEGPGIRNGVRDDGDHGDHTDLLPVVPHEDAAPEEEPDPVEADYDAHLRQREVEAEPVEFVAPRKRTGRWSSFKSVRAAEEMSPDPVDEAMDVGAGAEDDPDLFDLTGVLPAVEFDDHDVEHDDDDASVSADTRAGSPRGTSRAGRSSGYDSLFGGFASDADVERHEFDLDGDLEHDLTEGDEFEHHGDEYGIGEADQAEHRRTDLAPKAWAVGQSVLAVAFGAGMFFAFDQLWKWNMIVALVLSGLVILGLVAGVRVVRKSHDLSSTLIAMLVGGMVTFGPLALLLAR
ncbi:FUSC family protein [Mycobacterium sp. OTB74]|uniref:FUSC family protein n=1 Tax=Mycobacterium sp. OTB74 TaxID=1853452 RepID=UPI002476EF68|nr:FUSC family protein [Mycobacterium sp. OTB74]MDH6246328.1 hypothetical protein [Mycobacterium sp. OTB74]